MMSEVSLVSMVPLVSVVPLVSMVSVCPQCLWCPRCQSDYWCNPMKAFYYTVLSVIIMNSNLIT